MPLMMIRYPVPVCPHSRFSTFISILIFFLFSFLFFSCFHHHLYLDFNMNCRTNESGNRFACGRVPVVDFVDKDGNGNVSKEVFHLFYQEFFLS